MRPRLPSISVMCSTAAALTPPLARSIVMPPKTSMPGTTWCTDEPREDAPQGERDHVPPPGPGARHSAANEVRFHSGPAKVITSFVEAAGVESVRHVSLNH